MYRLGLNSGMRSCATSVQDFLACACFSLFQPILLEGAARARGRCKKKKLFVFEGRADPILEDGAGVAALVLSQRVHYAAILAVAIPTRVSDVLRQ